MWDIQRLELTVKVVAQLSDRSDRITREISAFFKAVSAPCRDFERGVFAVPFERLMLNIPSGIPSAIGIPGSFADAIKQVLWSIANVMAPIAAHYNFMGTIPAAVQSAEKVRATRCRACLKDAENAVFTIANLDRVLNTLFQRPDGLVQKLENYTQEMTQRLVENKTATRVFRKQFDEVVKAREETAKMRAPVRASAQQSIVSYRQALCKCGDTFRARNSEVRLLFNALQLNLARISEHLHQSAETVQKAVDGIDFVKDFATFVKETGIVRYDMRDLEFKAFQPKVEGIAIVPSKVEVSISPVYPIGLAKSTCDYYASGANQLSCKEGKSLFLMEPADGDWVLVLNPVTLMSGYVPSYCLKVVGHGLGVVLKDQANLSIGDCVALIDQSQISNYVVETAFGQQLTVSRGAVGVIYSGL
jgi:hypothetical protein